MRRPIAERRASVLTDALRDVVGMRADEYGRSGLFFVYLLFASSIYITSKTVRDTLFLSRLPISYLPWMFIGYGLVSPLVAFIHARVADRVLRHRLVIGTAAVSAASYVGVWVAVRHSWSPVIPAFYIWAEVVGSIFVSQFWMVAADYHTSRDAKRLFGVIGAGQVLGIVICGVGISALARTIGTENLIWLIVAMMAACVILVEIIRRNEVPVAGPGPVAGMEVSRLEAHPTAQTEGSPLSGRYARLVAGVIFMLFLVCTVADFQFKAIVRQCFLHSQPDEMAAYFGRLYGVIGAFAFVLQFFFTSRILAQFGLLVGLLVMPMSLFASTAWVLVDPRLMAASALKFSDNAFQYSINDASSQLLYFPFPQAAKGRIRAIIDGFFKPAAYAVAGLLVIGAAPYVRVAYLGAFTIPLIALWAVLDSSLCREYVTALTHTLRDRHLRHGHQSEVDAEGDLLTHQFLLAMVGDPDEETALFAFETLHRTAIHSLVPALGSLVHSTHPRVVRAALALIEEYPDRDHIPGVEALLKEETPLQTRCAAIPAYCAILAEEALDRVVVMGRSADVLVREAVLAGAMKYCGLEGVLACGAQLYDLLRSTGDADRELAARVLGHIGVRHFYRQLLPLFNDRSDRVRMAVAHAAGSIQNPRLIPPLTGMLGEDAAGRVASSSLVRFGDEAINALDIRLKDPKTPRDVAKAAARVLRRIATVRALQCLLEHIDHPDERVRRRVLRSAAQVHIQLGRPQVVSQTVLEQRLNDELKRAYQIVLEREVVLASYPGDVLKDTFDQDMHRSIDRIFSLLRILHDPDMMRRVRSSILHSHGPERANALEVLDNATAPHLKRLLLGLFEDIPASERAQRGSLGLGLVAPTADAWLSANFQGGGGWHRMAALDAVGLHKIQKFVPNVRTALADPVPLVREVAAWSLIRLLGADAASELAVLDDDPAASLRRVLALFKERYFSPSRPQGEGKEPIMLTTLEEVLFMRHITIFEGVSAEDLATLAELTEEHFAAAGQTIIKEGDPGNWLYLIVRGQVEVTVQGYQVAVLGPRECFGDLAILDGGPSAASVRALEPTDLLHISDADFHELLEDHAEVAMNVLKMLCNRLRTMNEKVVATAREAQRREAAGGGGDAQGDAHASPPAQPAGSGGGPQIDR